jgi:endo-1,4-beta-mannosidase
VAGDTRRREQILMVQRPNPRLDTQEPWLGVNFWSRRGGPLMWRTYDDELVRSELQVLVDHGLNVTRSFLYWPDFHPAPDVIDDASVERFRQFLVASEEVGIQTVPTFIVGHMSGANWDPAWRNGRDYYTDGFMLGQQAFFIREIVRRLGPSPAIAAWLVSNEMPLLGGPVAHEYGRAWGLVTTDAIRAGGSDLPVSLGDGVWGKEITGLDNGFRLRDQLDIVDFFGPHSYPMGSDPTRQLSRAAFICESSQLGKPVVVEEIGVTDTFAAPDHAGHYYRHTLHQTLLAGATGWMGWNNTDFELDEVEPYSSHLYELTFGITSTEGTPKPALLEMQEFGRVLRATDAAQLSRTSTQTAVLFPAHADIDLPVLDAGHQADREVMPLVVQHAWIAARAADLSPVIVRESEGLPDADLLVVPSNKALLGATFPALVAKAEAGCHVYVSWFAGVNPNQRGAWWPPLEPVFGVQHRLRYGISEIADDVLTLTLQVDLGGLPSGTSLVFPAAGDRFARAYLPIETTTAEVIATDQHGRAALVRQRKGDGYIYLCTYPIEYYGALRDNAHVDDEVWRLYGALAQEAGIRPKVRVDTACVFADQMVHADGTVTSWLVSTSPDATTVTPLLADGRLVDVLTGADASDKCELAPYGVRVLRHVSL